MKKILPVLLLLFVFIFCIQTSNASDDIDIEEVVLETAEEVPVQEAGVEEVFSSDTENKTLKDKLKDVYNLEISEYDHPSYLLEEVLKHKYPENSKLDYTKFWGAYNAYNGMNFYENGSMKDSYYTNALNVGFDGAFKDNNADFRLMLSFPPRTHRNVFQTLVADAYIATNKVPHHRFMLGHMRAPVGKEGGNSAYTLPFLNRAQIARNFGTVRKIGARAIGTYDFVDYDLGVYSSGTYFREFFPGAEFVGWINIKPLAKTNGKYGNLKIGGGLEGGHRDNNYCVTGAYVGYDYKRFMANFEWANANGYNGNAGKSINKHASGFYATLGYMITKKLQIIARYDQFDSDRKIKNDNKREYTIGLNYFIKGQALRLIMNYMFCENDNAKNSHKIMLGAQILL